VTVECCTAPADSDRQTYNKECEVATEMKQVGLFERPALHRDHYRDDR